MHFMQLPLYFIKVLEDAKVYSGHARKRAIDIEDIRLAVQVHFNVLFPLILYSSRRNVPGTENLQKSMNFKGC